MANGKWIEHLFVYLQPIVADTKERIEGVTG